MTASAAASLPSRINVRRQSHQNCSAMSLTRSLSRETLQACIGATVRVDPELPVAKGSFRGVPCATYLSIGFLKALRHILQTILCVVQKPAKQRYPALCLRGRGHKLLNIL
jgi:hypothetical protein